MRTTLVALALAFLAIPALAKERIQVPCTVGGRVVVTAGVNSTTRVLQSFPSCTITVYNTGTLTLSTIYSTNTGTPLANPFSANTSGFGYFYAANGTYDVQISGGGLASPYTFGAVIAFDVADYSPSADPPNLSIQYNVSNVLTGDANLTWNPTTQAVGIAGLAGTPALFVATGQIVSANDTYQGYTSGSDGIVSRGLLVLQNQAGTRGGYMVFPPITYNPYDSSTVCHDQWGNPVNQPLPLTGYNFGLYDAVIWNAPSPAMPANGSCGPPLPVNETYMGIGAGTGLNTNSYFLARGGFATDNPAFNSYQSLLGGAYVRLGYTADQALYLERHASSASLNAPSSICVIDTDPAPPPGCYGSIAYQGGSVFYYWNNTTLDWHTVDFSGGGGGGGCPGVTSSYVLYSNGTNCVGSGNFTWDNTNQLLTVAGVDNAHAAIATSAGYIQTTGGFLTTSTQGTSIQTSGGFTANNTTASIVPLTLKAASGQSANLMDLKNNAGTVIAHIGSSGTLFFPGAELGSGGLILDSITGMAQCLQIDTGGVVSGSGATCGAGGGAAPGAPSTSIQFNGGGTFTGDANFERTAPGGITTITLTGQGAHFADAATTVPLLVRGFTAQSADLQRWQSVTPTTLASIGSLGTFFGPGAALTGVNAATQVLIAKGAAAQSANIVEIQNSAATVLASIGSLGTITAPGFVGTNTTTNVTFQNTDDTKFKVTGAGTVTAANLTLNTITGSTQCLQVNTSGVVAGTGSACGGSGSVPGGVSGSIQYNSGSSTFAGSANATMDGNGNISIAGSGSVITIAGTNGGIIASGSNSQINLTTNTNRASIQTVGGFTAVIGAAATVGLTVKGNASQSTNLAEFQSSAGTLLSNVGSLGTWFGPGAALTPTNISTDALVITTPTSYGAFPIRIDTSATNHSLLYYQSNGTLYLYDNTGSGALGAGNRFQFDGVHGEIIAQNNGGAFPLLDLQNSSGTTVLGLSNTGTLTLSTISGSTQCLHVNSSGVVSGTGVECGAGGGGVTLLNSLSGSLSIAGTANQVVVTSNGVNTLTLSTPQSIGTSSNVQFGTVNGTSFQISGTTVIDTSRNLNSIASLTTTGNVTTTAQYQISNVTVIDSTRNLTNIGTVSAGAGGFLVGSLGTITAPGIVIGAGGTISNGSTGVTCSGAPGGSFATVNGIVTHC